jgi:hypothetical protein
MLVVRLCLLRVLPVAILVLVAIKASAHVFGHAESPRRVAERFLAASRADFPAMAAAPTGAMPLFADVAADLGIRFVHDNAARGEFRLPEEMGPGAAFVDIDGDGDLDVFVAGGGGLTGDGPRQSCRLYRNDGDRFTDITDASGAGIAGPAYGVACADYDDDGDVDILVTRLGPDALLRNDGPPEAPRFVDIAREAGVDDPGFGASAAFFDYDGDGLLDLYLARYVNWSASRETACYTILGIRDYCNPVSYNAPSTDRLYRNLGNGRFEDVSDGAGISARTGNGLGVAACDFDDDGWMDLYVANDQTPAFLWHNRGDGTFEEVAALVGCAYDQRGMAIAGMGVAAADLDDDGDVDLLVTNIHHQTHLVLTNDRGSFDDRSLAMGLGRWSIPATTFGVAVFDQDLDGALDAFFANGDVNVDNAMRVGENPYAQPDHFARLIDGALVNATAGSGVAFGDVGRGVACGDYDNDGDLDLLVTNNGGPLRLLRNDNDSGHSWLMVQTHTGAGGRAAIGARVTVTADDRVHTRWIRPHQSYLCSSDPRAHFGLGTASRVQRIEVRWPDGSKTVRTDVPVNQRLDLDADDADQGPAR